MNDFVRNESLVILASLVTVASFDSEASVVERCFECLTLNSELVVSSAGAYSLEIALAAAVEPGVRCSLPSQVRH